VTGGSSKGNKKFIQNLIGNLKDKSLEKPRHWMDG
jgi:hypothetical protein